MCSCQLSCMRCVLWTMDADGTRSQPHYIFIIFYTRSETHAGLQALSPADTSMHRQEKSPKHSAPVGTGI